MENTSEETKILLAAPKTLNDIARILRHNGHTYKLIKIPFKNFNHFWNSRTGLGLEVSFEAYKSLLTNQ
jgi:hypothetical protein